MHRQPLLIKYASFAALAMITACGGGGSSAPTAGNVTTPPSNPAPAPSLFALGGTVSGLYGNGKLTLQLKGGESLEIAGNGSFNFAKSLPAGSSYEASVVSHPAGQRCQVSRGSGSISNAPMTNIAVTCQFSLGGTVTGLNSDVKLVLQEKGGASLDVAGNGSFTFDNGLPTGGSYEVSISSQPAGQRCQVNQGSGTMSNGPVANVTVTCQTAYAYVLHTQWVTALSSYQTSVSQYTFGANGQLRPSGITDVPISADRAYMTVDPQAANAFFAKSGVNTIFSRTIGAKGELSATPTATMASGSMPLGTCVSPNGQFLYSFNYWDNSIYRYRLDATGGLDSTAAPVRVASVYSASGMAIAANGKHAYISDSYNSRIYQFSIALDGSLVPESIASVPADNSPMSVVLHPNGKFAYSVNNYGGSISQFTIGADGLLTPMPTPSVMIASRGMFMAISPNGKFAYANGTNDTILQFAIGADGQLTPLTPASVPATTYSMAMSFDELGNNAYVVNNTEKNVTQYTVAADGQLRKVGSIDTPGQPTEIAIFYR